MRQRPVPVTLGSPSFRSMSTRACLYTEARFSAGDILHPHSHDRPIMAVMLEGSFDTAISGRRYACTPGSAWTEPCEERHANYIGLRGARVLVMQPDPGATESFAFIERMIEDVVRVADPIVALDARRVLAEMDRADELSRLAVDALMVGMLVQVSRAGRPMRPGRRPPSWLGRVREVLSEEFRNPPSLLQLAGLPESRQLTCATPFASTRERRLDGSFDRRGRRGRPSSCGTPTSRFPRSQSPRGIRTRAISFANVAGCWALVPRTSGGAASVGIRRFSRGKAEHG